MAEVGHRKWWNRKLVFTLDVQYCAAGHQHLEARTGDEQVGKRRRGREDLLEVIQHEQQVLVTQEHP